MENNKKKERNGENKMKKKQRQRRRKKNKTQRRRKKREWIDNAAAHDTCKQFKKKKTRAIICGATNRPGSVMQKCPKNQ